MSSKHSAYIMAVRSVMLARSGMAARFRMAARLAGAAALLQAGAAFAKPEAPPRQALVSITSEPAGAAVGVDGAQRGVTPLDIMLPAGRRLIEVSLKDHEGAVRTVDCAPPSASADFKLSPIVAPVLIITEPAGVSVTRDGAFAGVTPLLLPEVAPGRYRIDLSLSGYKPQQVELTVANSTPQQIKTALVSSSAALSITSEPDGAQVSVNGIARGAAPLSVGKIQEGVSVVEITSPGFAPYKENVTLAAGESFSVHAKLMALPAKLRVISEPAGAKVYIDNQLRGEAPLTLPEIPAGEYRVRLDMTGYEPMARTVALVNEQDAVEEFRLLPSVGTLRVATSPAGASVFIGGKLYGATAAGTNATDQISEQLEITGVPAGDADIVFELKGYSQARRAAVIGRGQTLVMETVRLTRLFVPDTEVFTAHGAYKGVYINKDAEFYRIETSPGLIRAFPLGDIVRVRLIRATDAEEDARGLGIGD